MKIIELCGVVLLSAVVGLAGAGFIAYTKDLTSKRQVVAIDSGTMIKASSITAQGKLLDASLISEDGVIMNVKGTPIEVLAQVDNFMVEATQGKPSEQFTSQVYSFINCQVYRFIDTDNGTRYLTSSTVERYNLPQGTPLAKIKETIQQCIREDVPTVEGLQM